MLKSLTLSALLLAALPATAATHHASHTAAPALHALALHTAGKMTHDASGYSYQWPGIYFEGRFKGGRVTVVFDDPNANYNLLLDGKLLLMVMKPGHAPLLVTAPDDGPHTLRVEKRSETQYATGRFGGMFVTDAADALPAPTYARQIEFIGDSYTVGYGNTSAFTQCTPEDIFQTTDAQEGFPALVGKHYSADYQVEAFSGLGMVRNYDGHEHPKYRMPMLYPRAIFDDPAPAAQPDWHPQIIVVGIGGNDFSTPLHDDEPWKTRDALVTDYESTFVTFVQGLRAQNPGAFILIDAPPADRDEYNAAVNAVFTMLKTGGMTNIDELALPDTDNTGCNGHPNIHDDAKVAGVLAAYFDAHPGVWQGK